MEATDRKDDEIRDIPDIPQEIFRAAAGGKLVVFIGAGVSRIIGCPSWDELAQKQLNDLRDKGAINYYEYKNLLAFDARKLLSICKRIYEEKNIIPKKLASFFDGSQELKEKYMSIYNALYDCHAVYVTTNYDDYLDKLAQRPQIEVVSASSVIPLCAQGQKSSASGKVIYMKNDLLISALNNGNIIHLHGSVKEESSTVITITDYMRHYEPHGKPAVFLQDIFSNYTVLFVGYGLEEYEILEFIVTKSQVGENEARHFMLYPIFKKESNLLSFQKKYYLDLGIQLVPYSIDDNGYEQLVAVIETWAKQIGPIAKPQGFLEKIKLIDEVI